MVGSSADTASEDVGNMEPQNIYGPDDADILKAMQGSAMAIGQAGAWIQDQFTDDAWKRRGGSSTGMCTTPSQDEALQRSEMNIVGVRWVLVNNKSEGRPRYSVDESPRNSLSPKKTTGLQACHHYSHYDSYSQMRLP